MTSQHGPQEGDILGALAAGQPAAMPAPERSGADVSVRPALVDDVSRITELQLAAWQALLEVTGGSEALADIDEEAITEQWRSSITSPPTDAHRVLAACHGPHVVGFAAFAPVADTEAGQDETEQTVDVLAMEVAEDATRQGHGSRLLAACADLAREQGATALQTWAVGEDEARTRFLQGAGLAPSGMRRRLALPGGGEAIESCWHAQL